MDGTLVVKGLFVKKPFGLIDIDAVHTVTVIVIFTCDRCQDLFRIRSQHLKPVNIGTYNSFIRIKNKYPVVGGFGK